MKIMGDWLHTQRVCPIGKHTEEDKNQFLLPEKGVTNIKEKLE